jgi:hypothetical protein
MRKHVSKIYDQGLWQTLEDTRYRGGESVRPAWGGSPGVFFRYLFYRSVFSMATPIFFFANALQIGTDNQSILDRKTAQIEFSISNWGSTLYQAR